MFMNHELPQWIYSTPFSIFLHGYFWVVVFFILSGFVLTLRFFKIRKHTCITGGTFRRYLRLMIPVWVTLSLYYFVLKMDFLIKGDLGDFARIEHKTFFDLAYDSIFNVWYGDNTWTIPIWTLSLELIATFMVYLIA
jgi:peptidoglycan/LPS O-acetylase OafA/YrhL